jgi:hypothetical protein
MHIRLCLHTLTFPLPINIPSSNSESPDLPLGYLYEKGKWAQHPKLQNSKSPPM